MSDVHIRLQGWRRCRLKHLAQIPIRNGLGEAGSFDDPDWPRYIRITDFAGPRQLRRDTFKSLPPDVAAQAAVEKNDLLLAAVGATFGNTYLHDAPDGPACYAGYLVRFRAGSGVDPRFIAYWTESAPYWHQMRSRVVQSIIQNFSASKYKDLELRLPPYTVQSSIADFLDRETARIDELVDKKIQLIELLEEKRTALITQAVSKGLNPLVPMKSSGIPSLGQFPQHWRRKRLKQVIRRLIDAEHKTVHFVENGDYPVIRTSDVRRGRMHIDQARRTDAEGYAEWTRRGQPRPGDVLFSREAPVGEAALVPEHPPVCLGQRMVLIRTRQAELRSSLLVHWLYTPVVSEFIDLASQGSTVRHLNMRDIPNIPVVVPPISEQAEIADRCEWIDTRLKALEEKLSLQLNLLAEYRQALITAAVTGQIDVAAEQPESEGATI